MAYLQNPVYGRVWTQLAWGVIPDGVKVAAQCQRILAAHGIDDVHISIRESKVFHSAGQYKPAFTSNGTAGVREPFSTALGLAIFPEGTPYIEGTGGFVVSDPRNPGKLYLVTARRRLEAAGRIDEEKDVEKERKHALDQLEQAKKMIKDLERFLVDASRDWKEQRDRVLDRIIDATNFVGNVIDLGTTIPVAEFTRWMLPHPAPRPLFQYPGNRLLQLYGTVTDEDMGKPSAKTLDRGDNACIMAMKRGYASDLTVGRIRSFTRRHFAAQLQIWFLLHLWRFWLGCRRFQWQACRLAHRRRWSC
ncbi:hypothetical protein BV25DRAFT_1840378 [Artomyces pyxidatus]|uniref:Uncharacterized protein n=1 Tax=Artomyces pyxidatus TaxID=48021 RepID=A0ACB8SU40_9AGAM|nr:hypothetical protein BV25DRAFT_1840378 [Artomyces pyxidatus]